MVEGSLTSRFLQAEEEANLLVDHLTDLKKEVENYSSAREGLEKTTAHVIETLDKLSELAGKIGDVTLTLKDIGTPQILNQIASLEEKVEGISEYQRRGLFSKLFN